MNNIKIATLAIAVATLISACASPLQKGMNLGDPASIADAAPSVQFTQGTGLMLEAKPMKNVVELGEPVYLAVQVTNTSDKPMKLVGGLRPGEGFVEVTIMGGQKEEVVFSPLTEGDFETTTTIKPGASIGSSFPIFFGNDGWSFKAPGNYQVKAMLTVPYDGQYATYESKPMNLEVTDSRVGKALFETDERLSFEAGKFLVWRRGDHLKRGQNQLVKVAIKNRDSALATYVWAAFATSFSEPFADYNKGAVRAPNCRSANDYRSQINYKLLPVNLQIEDSIGKAKCFAETKNWRGAQKELEQGLMLTNKQPQFKNYEGTLMNMNKLLKQFM